MAPHEQGLHGKRISPAIELAYPGGNEAGLPLTSMELSGQNSATNSDVTYVMYDHQAAGLRGYTRRFSQMPRSDNSSSLFSGSEQYMELEIPASTTGIIKQIRCELNCTFVRGVTTPDTSILPSDQWISRIEVRGGGSAGSVLETIRGDVQHLERAYRMSDVEAKCAARDMLWGENDADLFMPAYSTASGGATTDFVAATTRRFQIELITPLTDAQVYAPSLNLSDSPLVIRVYFRGTVFSQDLSGTPATVSVSACRFWIEEHVLNESDAVAAAQVLNDHPIVYRCLSRMEFVRSKGGLSDSTEYNDLLQNLQGLSAGMLIYIKEDSETTQTTAVTASSPEGELAHFHQLTSLRLLDRNNGPIIEEETDEINRLSTQRPHLSLPIWYNDSATVWYSYLIPFCDDFSAALHGQHTGARALTGSETLYYTTATAPLAAASIHVVSYDYAAWVCRRGAPPQYLIARVGA